MVVDLLGPRRHGTCWRCAGHWTRCRRGWAGVVINGAMRDAAALATSATATASWSPVRTVRSANAEHDDDRDEHAQHESDHLGRRLLPHPLRRP
ncbi:hypothetical protein F9B16_00315 [Actinomadura montaniterrae]|uniref:Uncharacterized protein n=1 Tax=Actinomadura montaniterrae TaxID=1803903 RepID=A0A6L3W6I4_9ACTN|nr:hypothetical protein F9B16_00315 [Actinomadura montaniterrae]